MILIVNGSSIKLPNAENDRYQRTGRDEQDIVKLIQRDGYMLYEKIQHDQKKLLPRRRRAVTALPERLWNNATVPYVVGPNITAVMLATIHQAMAHWEENTCIRFVKRTTQKDYIEFAPGSCGCCSFVGRRGNGRQYVTLSPHCTYYGVVIHELGHVIGFWHEHSRPDRDQYITIVKDNIEISKQDNFQKKSIFEIDSLGQPYDYYSIMHYKEKTFSKNGKVTIETIQPNIQIGQRVALSPGDIMQASLLYNCPRPSCDKVFNTSYGKFSTPNYPIKYYKSHQCTWVIHSIPGHIVHLEFSSFSLETSMNCTFDYIEVREGTSEHGALIGRLCGEGSTGIIHSSVGLWIRFHSDATVSLKGMEAEFRLIKSLEQADTGSGDGSGGHFEELQRSLYIADCDQDLTHHRGGVSSPLVPVRFTGVVRCAWRIGGGANATRVKVSLLRRTLSKTSRCLGNIYVLTENSKQRTGEFDRYKRVPYNCANTSSLVLNTSKVVIHWSSDVHDAVHMAYIVDYDECAAQSHKCAHDCINTMSGYHCACHRGYILTNGQECLPKLVQFSDTCNSTLTSIRGRVRSSTEPYGTCDWYIKQKAKQRIMFSFSKFNIPSSANCSNTYVEVLAGEGKDLTSKGRYCGKELPSAITTVSGKMVIRLHMTPQKGVRMPYFSARYIVYNKQESFCYKRLTGKGLITSPNFPKTYPHNYVCIWRITVKSKHRIKLKFDTMDIENTKNCEFDYVEIHDGRHRISPLLGRYCGKKIPRKILSTGRHLWLMFITDESGAGRGFQLHYSPEAIMPNATGKIN
ncbi:tolloid-like protein 2 [Lingula anatina]|uniref:Metalloendopeptidase n=1 Tax=Lingula anatina TaxID=7574 RepID=A0A1S3H484_LINAN|nr:tolloid-like protein 2 [Lingula anatina]|eukprot:XP_013379949.1 tolloid-like protein 2 [Lingula anatina]